MSKQAAHFWALFCIIVWGSSFVGTSVLLRTFSAAKLVFYRFVIGYLIILLYNHKPLKMKWKDELGMVLFGLIGITVYYLCESNALRFTYAANVSILVTFAPVLTMILTHFITKDEPIHKQMILGSIIALVGVVLVIFNGQFVLQLSPIGDFLALGAALCWALYSLFLKYYTKHYDEMLVTRRLLFYGCLTLIPCAIMERTPWHLEALLIPEHIGLFVLLGALSSGACYALWNISNARIGIVAANIYLYVSPFVTLVAAYVFLREPITLISVLGCILIVGGVAWSEKP